jgi:U6 snRNA-associated Sm-like protein LSm8
MASTLSEWTTKQITILTCDGRLITGTLLGYDQLQNLILSKSYESVYSTDAPVEKVELGLSVVRGDNVAVVGECEEESEGDGEVRAEPIKPIVQNVT